MGGSISFVTLEKTHFPNSQVYSPMAVLYGGKTHFGYIATIEDANSFRVNAYYMPSYGTMNGCPNGSNIYGIVSWFTA